MPHAPQPCLLPCSQLLAAVEEHTRQRAELSRSVEALKAAMEATQGQLLAAQAAARQAQEERDGLAQAVARLEVERLELGQRAQQLAAERQGLQDEVRGGHCWQKGLSSTKCRALFCSWHSTSQLQCCRSCRCLPLASRCCKAMRGWGPASKRWRHACQGESHLRKRETFDKAHNVKRISFWTPLGGSSWKLPSNLQSYSKWCFLPPNLQGCWRPSLRPGQAAAAAAGAAGLRAGGAAGAGGSHPCADARQSAAGGARAGTAGPGGAGGHAEWVV